MFRYYSDVLLENLFMFDCFSFNQKIESTYIEAFNQNEALGRLLKEPSNISANANAMNTKLKTSNAITAAINASYQGTPAAELPFTRTARHRRVITAHDEDLVHRR